jgi:hypothetical protein
MLKLMFSQRRSDAIMRRSAGPGYSCIMNISRRFFQIADEALSSIDGKAQSLFAGYDPWPQKSKDLYGTYYYREARKTEAGFFLGYALLEKDRRYLSLFLALLI